MIFANLTVFGQIFVFFTPAVGFYDQFFPLKSWYSDVLSQKKKTKIFWKM